VSESKHEVSFVSGQTTREITRGAMLAYMKRKGFRVGAQLTGDEPTDCRLYTLGKVDEFKPSDPSVELKTSKGDDRLELRSAIVQIAACLKMEPHQVLREIAGEPITMNAAWDALVRAIYASKGCVPPDNYNGESAEAALGLALGWRFVAKEPANDGRESWVRIAQAAEDLAGLALNELRWSRNMPRSGEAA
jgi:hypothetical protein